MSDNSLDQAFVYTKMLASKDLEISRLREVVALVHKEITSRPLAKGNAHERDLWLRSLVRQALEGDSK